MSMRETIVGRGKRLAMSPTVLRVVSDDRVMRLFNGVMDGRNRVRAAAEKAGEAWFLLLNGRAMPMIDPSLDESVPTVDGGQKTNGYAARGAGPEHGANGAN